MYILKLSPVFQNYLWGGQKLKALYEKDTKHMDTVAEAWVLSAHPDGTNIVENGEYAGLPFPLALERMGRGALGERAENIPFFPIMIKFIDAKDRLSVQVHPDDAYAGRAEGSFGKSEMWVVLSADPGAEILYDFKEPCTRKEAERAIKEERFHELLNAVPVKAGDAFYIPAGTVHAIGKGCLIAEVQQNSNITYRVYDYARRDKNGNTRPLHTEKALDVMNFTPLTHELVMPRVCQAGVSTSLPGKKVCLTPYFRVHTLSLSALKTSIAVKEDSFLSVVLLRGEGEMDTGDHFVRMKAGESYFVPAGYGVFSLSGDGEALLASL